MNRIVLTGVLALSAALPALHAQLKVKSQAEADALKAIFGASTNDARIAACEDFVTKFADSEFKATALYFEAISYEQKGDYDHSLVFGERTLAIDPKHYQAMLMMAQEIAAHIGEYDLDKAQKLAQVNKYASAALELLKDAPKPNQNITDDQWAGAKKDFAAQAHAALGAADLADKKFAPAETELKAAIDGANQADPATMVRLGKAYSEDGKFDDAIAQFDKVMAINGINPVIRQIAQAERVRAIQRKAAANPAAPKPDAPKPDAPKADAPKQ